MKRGRRLVSEQGLAYFITTTLSGFVELFSEDRYAQIILSNLDFYRSKFEFKLVAYVIMPQHLHLIVMPGPKGNISEIMRDFKKRTAREIVQLLEQERRFDVLGVFREKVRRYHPKDNRNYQVWEDRFDDVALYSYEVFRIKLDYIHSNPVKAGVTDSPSDYTYSSARNYMCGDHSAIWVDCEEGFSVLETGTEVGSEVRSRT